jgi:hypothetical protein
VSSRIEFGSAGLNGFPRFVQCSDQSANFVRTKRPNVFLEIPVHYKRSVHCLFRPGAIGEIPGDPRGDTILDLLIPITSIISLGKSLADLPPLPCGLP